MCHPFLVDLKNKALKLSALTGQGFPVQSYNLYGSTFGFQIQMFGRISGIQHFIFFSRTSCPPTVPVFRVSSCHPQTGKGLNPIDTLAICHTRPFKARPLVTIWGLNLPGFQDNGKTDPFE